MMKRNSLILAVTGLLGLMVLVPAHAENKTVTLSVPGMDCEACPITVSKALKKVDGVAKVAASLEQKEAVVIFDDAKTNVDALRKATANAGYPSMVKQ
jgi:periplasmic mercuric ion binding protein